MPSEVFQPTMLKQRVPVYVDRLRYRTRSSAINRAAQDLADHYKAAEQINFVGYQVVRRYEVGGVSFVRESYLFEVTLPVLATFLTIGFPAGE